MKKIFILIGKPGSGKDTQAILLQSRIGGAIIRTGDMIRALAKTNTNIAQILSRGALVDNKIVNQLFADFFTTEKDCDVYISDGFPRHIDQAHWLDDFAQKNNAEIARVFLLDITDDISFQRLNKRDRADDNSEVVAHRLKLYYEETMQVVRHYEAQSKLSIIDATDTVVNISTNINQVVNAN